MPSTSCRAIGASFSANCSGSRWWLGCTSLTPQVPQPKLGVLAHLQISREAGDVTVAGAPAGAELLNEHGGAGGLAVGDDTPHPIQIQWPGAAAGLATDHYPIQLV